jgi:hypothetical protein
LENKGVDKGTAVSMIEPDTVLTAELPPMGRADDTAVSMVLVTAVADVARVGTSEHPTETVTVETAQEAAQAVTVSVTVVVKSPSVRPSPWRVSWSGSPRTRLKLMSTAVRHASRNHDERKTDLEPSTASASTPRMLTSLRYKRV